MTNNKEEILGKYPQSLNEVLHYHRTFVLMAMEEHAKAFEMWKRDNHIEWNGKHGHQYYEKNAGEPLPYNPKTITDLYSLWEQTKK